ncbi:MAG: glycoside hydrolase family 2 [Verrucomicrobia bacterium]|nr:glycoside hydrolase family 2 [Verrucomicrobiota bacterium]
MKKTILLTPLLCMLLSTLNASDWKPAPCPIPTQWTAKVNPAEPWPEYPRPQMVRAQWTNLNGLWDYAITDLDAAQPAKFDGKILVPFPIESALSGVKKPVTDKQRLWYRRTFDAPKLDGGKRLLLHFGAVDWEAKVFVNGKPVGEHRGGYDAFTFDITDAVKAGAGNELIVAVFDATGGYQPKGKQHFPAIEKPGGIMYVPCTGIWQTVWLETVPAGYTESLKIVPDVDNSAVEIVGVPASAGNQPPKGGTPTLRVKVFDGGRLVGTGEGKAGERIIVRIPQPKLWSPDSPFLYDLRVECGPDVVRSYFGMRKIALGKDERGITRPMLNGKFVFQSGPLDQGFWPDGIYLAPTDEALRYDIEMTKKLGFNMARKHVKVEPDRWYYWADKLGLLVWQDMPSGAVGKGAGKDKKTGEVRDGTAVSPEAGAQFEKELKAMIETHWNHPSIIMWIVFNEGWGQHDTPRLTKWVKGLDPSRLVNNASGWHDIPAGDIVDMHKYPGPGSPPPEPARAAVLGEFGGLGLATPGHIWVQKTWGYRGMSDQRTLTKKYCDLWRQVWQLKDDPGLCAAVYTQTTDVETECNGLLTYDRKVVKVDLQQAADAARGKLPPPPQIKVIVPTSEAAPVNWRYTTEKPADGWFRPGFDASSWKEGPAGFGGKVPNAEGRTPWKTSDIWLRREVVLPEGKLHHPMFRCYHDEDVKIYVNGVIAATGQGFTTSYEEMELTDEGRATLKPGKNLIAIHCHQTSGGQYIDLGIVDEIETPK